MINAVIELGDRRLHEVMVPRIAIVVAPGVVLVRRGHRHGRSTRATRASPCTRRRSTRSSASCTRRTCCRSSSPTSARAPGPAHAAPHAGVRARVDVDRRPPARVPAAQGPHRDRARRVRRDGGPGHDRGPARGDRRRDPGRVRRRGADGRAAGRRPRRGSTAGRRSTTCWTCSTSRSPLEDDDEYDTVGGLVYHRIGGVPTPGDEVARRRAAPDRRDHGRPPGGQGARGPRALGRRRVREPTTTSRPRGGEAAAS